MNARGCFTLDKFLAGRNLKEIEERIGFRKGRLSKGGIVVALSRLPGKGEFKVAGYTNVSLHNFVMPGGLDPSMEAGVRESIREAFVFGFRIVMLICAGLALASAAVAWVMIPKDREKRAA